MKEIFTYKCPDCSKVFRTDNPEQKICTQCMGYRKPAAKYKPKKKKTLTFNQIMQLAEKYRKVNGKYIHYGTLVHLLEEKPNNCVCCGNIAVRNKHICKRCEKISQEA